MRLSLRKVLGGIAATVALMGMTLVLSGAPAAADPAEKAAPLAAGVFRPIKNVGNGMCLQPASTAEFAAIVQQPCVAGSIAQGWQTVSLGGTKYRFLNQLSGYCFDAFDGALNNARLLQGTCVAISNEEFNTGSTLPNVVQIQSRVGFRDTGYCVDVPGGSATAGLAMQIYRCNGTLAQRWVVGFA
ncbi:RICIN domain-containing protein [Dactylosporangium sp. NPDC050588]|uniref:RICIN domain-containing protein n=1 Tax=Dactylosporangium sp. NPDC050588 TaxID=3157211 RepID=UPI0033F1DF32